MNSSVQRLGRLATHPRDTALRGVAGARGWRWARAAVGVIRADVRADGLAVAVPVPPTVRPGSLRGARLALRRDRATCLEKSLVIQRWWASSGVALDVIVGVRHPSVQRGPTAHAWVEHYDADCSSVFGEIRRVPAPGGKPPRLTPR